MSLEDTITHFLPLLFSGVDVDERAVFRVTRNAHFMVSDDAADLLEAVEEGCGGGGSATWFASSSSAGRPTG